jgi:hypothetical protein
MISYTVQRLYGSVHPAKKVSFVAYLLQSTGALADISDKASAEIPTTWRQNNIIGRIYSGSIINGSNGTLKEG